MILLVQKYFEKLQGLQRDMLNDARHLTHEQLTFRSKKGSWSILEVFDHLIVAEGNGLKYLGKKIQGIDKIKRAGITAALRSFILNTSLRSPFKYKAPQAAAIQPRDHYDFKEIEQEWNNVREHYRDFLDHLDKTASEKLIFKHPVAGRFNIIQTLDFQFEHLAHHQKQIERIKNHPAYPK